LDPLRSPIIDESFRFTGALVNQQQSAATTTDFFNDIDKKRKSRDSA